VPTQKAIGGFGFRDPGFPDAAIKVFQTRSRMIAFVADDIAGLIPRRARPTSARAVSAGAKIPQ
jgi:hypothetical protein